MTGRWELTFSRAEELSAALGAASEHIAETLDALERELGALREQWSGGAAEAYQQASSQIARELGAVNAILRQAEQVTLAIADRHREAEAEVQALWE